MSSANTIVDQFNTTEDEVYVPNMKIKSNNVWFNLLIEYYPRVEDASLMYEWLYSRTRIDCFHFHADEVVITCWFYDHVQQDDKYHNIPDGIKKQQDFKQEEIFPNSLTFVRRTI